MIAMSWYAWFTFAALLCCLAGLGFHVFRLIRLGAPEDFARPAGAAGAGIVYSFTGAMDPRKKESAYLHLPTYTAGLIYHLGTFVSFLLFALFFFFDARRRLPGCGSPSESSRCRARAASASW